MRRLGALEQVVMDRIWSSDRPTAVREVLQDLLPARPLAYTTVMTVMDNLHRKGVLAREKAGRAYLYRPVLSREQHSAALMEEALSSSTDRTATLLHFVEQMPAEEAAELRRALGHHPEDVDGAAP